MKMRRMIALALMILMLAAVFAGCGADSGKSGAMEDAAGYDNGIAENSLVYSDQTEVAGTSSNLPENQKWIRTIYLDAETEALDSLLETINQQVAALNGYVESRNIYNGSSYSTYRSRNANLTIRIPADQADEFITQVSDVSNIISTNETLENITLTYVATESRMEALQVEEDRLLELMEQAETMSDLLEIEARLTDVRYELESVTSQLRSYDNLVDYATVHLDLREVQVLTPAPEEGLWQRIRSGFVESLQGLGNLLEELLVWFLTKLPYLILIAVIAVTVVVLAKRFKKKKKDRKPPFPTQLPTKEDNPE
ncbi:MAG: DUF4349 domain-containing protein [Oscillospiraceae bacterium]|nr:DUF4349 domain-containing protein [Oscillospiraceae bacterium]